MRFWSCRENGFAKPAIRRVVGIYDHTHGGAHRKERTISPIPSLHYLARNRCFLHPLWLRPPPFWKLLRGVRSGRSYSPLRAAQSEPGLLVHEPIRRWYRPARFGLRGVPWPVRWRGHRAQVSVPPRLPQGLLRRLARSHESQLPPLPRPAGVRRACEAHAEARGRGRPGLVPFSMTRLLARWRVLIKSPVFHFFFRGAVLTFDIFMFFVGVFSPMFFVFCFLFCVFEESCWRLFSTTVQIFSLFFFFFEQYLFLSCFFWDNSLSSFFFFLNK